MKIMEQGNKIFAYCRQRRGMGTKKGQVFFVRGGRRGERRKWAKIELNRNGKLSSLNRDDEDVGLCAERQKFIVFSDGSCGVR